MNVTITARHCAVPDALRQRTERSMRRLLQYDPRILSADVAFDREHETHVAESRLEIAGEPVLFARATASEFGPALDRTVDRLRRQLKRRRERARDHHRAVPASNLASLGDD